MSVWEALVGIDRAQPRVGEQLVAALREAIAQGRLPPGTRLPSSRDLANDLGVSRGLVVGAYERLTEEGRLVARRGSGTVVTAVGAGASLKASGWGPAGEPRAGTSPEDVVQPVPAPLRPGVPDLGLFPRTAWRRAYEQALSTAQDADFDYPDPAGAPRLRVELAAHLGQARGARVSPDALVITSGASQAYELLAVALRDAGATRVAVEEPGAVARRDRFAAHGLAIAPIRVDAGGLDVTQVIRSRPQAVLLTPAHQYPTGVVLAAARRAELVGWARGGGVLLIEDDHGGEFRYDREPVACLQGLAPGEVAMVGSVSQTLAPALRLGWLALPEQWRAPVRAAKLAADRGGPTLEHLAVAQFLADGGYEQQLRRARRIFRERREVLVAALRRYLPPARISGVPAGLHLLMELPAGVDDAVVSARARALGLHPVALSELRTRPGPPGLVLGYAAHQPPELTRAVRSLARAVGV